MLFVDLPGYGFARVPLPVKARWRELVEGYLLGRRRALRGVMVLVDLRRGIEADDAQLLDFLAAHAIPSVVVATKTDKLARGPGLQALARLAAARPESPPIGFSAATGDGAAAVWEEIDRLLRLVGRYEPARRASDGPGSAVAASQPERDASPLRSPCRGPQLPAAASRAYQDVLTCRTATASSCRRVRART